MRLNAAVRNEITKNATKTLNEREAALLKREMALEEECYTHALPLELRRAIEKVNTLAPRSSWYRVNSEVSYNVGGQRVKFYIADGGRCVPFGYAAYCSSLGGSITLEKHAKLVEKVRAWQGDQEQFTKDKKTAELTLKTVLKSVGSTESLFKVWPEGKKFYSSPPLAPLAKTGVPAVQMQALNTMLGLSA